MNTKESIKNEIFTLESRELNEGKKVAFIAVLSIETSRKRM